MRSFITLLAAAGTAALLVVGCGSDGDSSPGSAGSSGVAMCVGSYADFTPDAFLAKHTDGLGCTADDASIVCSNDLVVYTGACGKGCLGMGDDAAQAVCVGKCLDGKLSKPLTASCTTCYEADVECARKNCLFECGIDPTSDKCAVCRSTKGCAGAFYECSGLPAPTGSDDGAGGSVGDDSAAGAGGS